MNIKNKKFGTVLVCMALVALFQNCGAVKFSDNMGGSSPTFAVSTSGTDTDTPSSNPTVLNETNLVECDLGGPSAKIILNNIFQSGSNASATRVCMSENACLNLINAYSAARDCGLSAGPALSSSGAQQCTDIFPGSQGTCNNAASITDAQVASILSEMAN